MNATEPVRRPIQFSILALLILMTVLGVMIANWRVTLWVFYVINEGLFWPVWLTICGLSFAAGQRCQSSRPRLGCSWQRVVEVVCTVLAVVMVGYCLWVHLRWMDTLDISHYRILPQPYPDKWLWILHEWFDRRYPPPAGSFKLRGEFHRVLMVIGAGCFVVSIFWGCVLGLVLRLDYTRLRPVLQFLAREFASRVRTPWTGDHT